MERNSKTVRIAVKLVILLVVPVTLLSCRQNGGQVTPKTDITSQQREVLLQVVRILCKAQQQRYCLSAPILTASDTNACFDCHDKIRR